MVGFKSMFQYTFRNVKQFFLVWAKVNFSHLSSSSYFAVHLKIAIHLRIIPYQRLFP